MLRREGTWSAPVAEIMNVYSDLEITDGINYINKIIVMIRIKILKCFLLQR